MLHRKVKYAPVFNEFKLVYKEEDYDELLSQAQYFAKMSGMSMDTELNLDNFLIYLEKSTEKLVRMMKETAADVPEEDKAVFNGSLDILCGSLSMLRDGKEQILKSLADKGLEGRAAIAALSGSDPNLPRIVSSPIVHTMGDLFVALSILS